MQASPTPSAAIKLLSCIIPFYWIASLAVAPPPWLGLHYLVAISHKPGVVEEYTGVELMSVVG